MASKRDSRRSKVVRQTFQNSNQVVELTLKTIPKSALQGLTSVLPPFVRDCALKKEIQNVVKEKNNNTSDVGSKNVGKLALNNANIKTSGGQVSIEVSRKKSSKKQHNIVPREATWETVLHSCSTISSHSESDIPVHSTLLYDSSESSSNVVNEKSPPIPCDRNSQGIESRCSESRKKQSKTDKSHHQDNYSVQTPLHIPAQLQQNVNNSSNEREYSHKTGNIPEKLESLPQNHHFQAQSGQGGVHENDRLLSDDVNASPFGESALQLLQQLKERLQSRGDNEGTDLVGVIEAFIGGQGSFGGVGAGNPQPLMSTVSPLYTPVFLTPTDQNNVPHFLYNNLPQYHKYKHIKNRVPVDLYGEEVAPEPHTEQTRKEHIQQDLQDEQQSGNENPQRTPDHPTNQKKYPCQSNLQQLPNQHNLNQASDHHTTHNDHCQIPQEMNDHSKLIREIANQKEIMADQERIITELRKLSAQLIAQQEQIASKNLQQDEVGTLNCNCHIDGQRHMIDGDSGVGIESREKSSESELINKVAQSGECEKGEADHNSKDIEVKERDTDVLNQTEQEYRSMLLQLNTENETLRREVRSQRELVVNLEIQLTKANYLLELERRSQLGLFASKLSGSAPNLDLLGHHMRSAPNDRSSHIGPPSNCGESEADSAYEEKTGSHLTSKISSPHSDRQKGQDCSIGPAGVSSLQVQQNEEDRNPKVQNVNDIDTDNALLQTQYINKEGTVPYAFKNSAIIPSSHLISQLPASETQELPEAIRFCTSDQSPEALKLSSPENFIGNSRRKTTKTARAQKSYLAKTRGILNDVGVRVSDLNPKPWVSLEYPTDSSFSTVSDQIQDGTVTNETSFVEGIKAPRHSRNPKSQKGKIDSAEDISNSVIGLLQPLESTRVQEGSELQVDIKDDESTLFVPIKANNSFESVDELE